VRKGKRIVPVLEKLITQDTDDGISDQGATFTQAAINAGNLRFVPAQYASGGPGYTQAGYGTEHQTYAAFSYTVTDGTLSSNTAQVNIDVTAVATAPTLKLGATSTSQQLFDTGWEDAPNSQNQKPVLVTSGVLDGWSLVTQRDDGEDDDSGFEIWQSGDQMRNAAGQSVTVQAAPGDGSKFLELDPANGDSDTLGISRQISRGCQLFAELRYGRPARLRRFQYRHRRIARR
jgi:hypothetical protein